MAAEEMMKLLVLLKNQGNGLFKEKNFVRATEKYLAALEVIDAPDNRLASELHFTKIDLCNNLAINYLNMEDSETNIKAAMKYSNMALAIDPENIIALHRKGMALGLLKQYDEAMDVLHRAILLEPEGFQRESIETEMMLTAFNRDAMNQRGKVKISRLNEAEKHKSNGNRLFEIKEYQKAIEKYLEVVELSERNDKDNTADSKDLDWQSLCLKSYNNLAACHLKLGQRENAKQAKEYCAKVLEFDEKNVKALFRRAKACQILQENTEALEDLDKMLGLEVDHKDALNLRELVLKQMTQNEELMTHFREANSLIITGKTLFKKENWDESSACFMDVINLLEPFDNTTDELAEYRTGILTNAYLSAAECNLASTACDPVKANILIEKLLKIDGNNLKALALHGKVLRLLGQYKESITVLEDALKSKDDELILKELTLSRKKYDEMIEKEQCEGKVITGDPPSYDVIEDVTSRLYGNPETLSSELDLVPELDDLLADHKLLEDIQDPKVVAAFIDIATDPKKRDGYRNDPKIWRAFSSMEDKFKNLEKIRT